MLWPPMWHLCLRFWKGDRQVKITLAASKYSEGWLFEEPLNKVVLESSDKSKNTLQNSQLQIWEKG